MKKKKLTQQKAPSNQPQQIKPMTPAQYKKLQAKWYKKLADEGFQDIESPNSPKEMLKQWDSFYFQARYAPQDFEDKQKYYEMAREFLHVHKFESRMEKQVWEMYSEGVPYQEIGDHIGHSKFLVHKIVNKLKGIMLCLN
jgi:hypothetical protein